MKIKKMTKKQLTKIRVDDIKDRMKTDKFLLQCMLKIFSFQTSWEKQDDTTQVWNDVGFSGVDVEFLSSVSNQYIKKGYLSDKQMVYVRKRMIKVFPMLKNINIEIPKNKLVVITGVSGSGKSTIAFDIFFDASKLPNTAALYVFSCTCLKASFNPFSSFVLFKDIMLVLPII